jgi:hypothetical protein
VNYNSLGRRALRTPATQPGHWSRPVTQPSKKEKKQKNKKVEKIKKIKNVDA